MLDAVVFEIIAKAGYSQEFVEFAEGYSVNRDGAVKSTRRNGEKILKPNTSGRYHQVTIYEGNKRRELSVHRIVAEVFHGPIPEDRVVDHIDGNRANNNAANLQYLTHSDNCRKGRNAKLTLDQVKRIKTLKGALPVKRIARHFGISTNAIYNIHNGKKWAGV